MTVRGIGAVVVVVITQKRVITTPTHREICDARIAHFRELAHLF